jgi:hypothetical protein
MGKLCVCVLSFPYNVLVQSSKKQHIMTHECDFVFSSESFSKQDVRGYFCDSQRQRNTVRNCDDKGVPIEVLVSLITMA